MLDRILPVPAARAFARSWWLRAMVALGDGEDAGVPVRGNTENLKFIRDIGDLPHRLQEASARILNMFWSLTSEGEIIAAQTVDGVKEKIDLILQKLKG